MKKNSFPQKTDVMIVGAGPAGSTAAYELARLGIDVTLIDKAKFPRGKTCAGGVNLRTLRLFPFELGPVVEKIITGIVFTRNLTDHFVRRYSDPLMIIVRRDTFDHFLMQQAKQAGAQFLDGTRFLFSTEKSDGVRVETSSGTCLASFVLGADGANSEVAKKLNLMREVSHLLTFHSEVPTSLIPWPEADVIHIDWGSLKRSYAYLFPKENFLSLGAGGFGIPSGEIKNYHAAFLTTLWQKEETPPFSAAGFIVPLRRKRSPIQKGRCLLLGDAAGLINPFTGEGVYSAIRSAQIATPVLAAALKDGRTSLEDYQEAIDHELMPELECSRLFREIFNLRPFFFHKKIASNDRWWSAMVQILRGEKTFLDLNKKLGPLGSLLLRMAR
jgi:geranylgeranyl reductase family protein